MTQQNDPLRNPSVRIVASHSCGDCGHLGSYEEHKAHLRRRWHRAVESIGLDAALDTPELVALADARRAEYMFREDGDPFRIPPPKEGT